MVAIDPRAAPRRSARSRRHRYWSAHARDVAHHRNLNGLAAIARNRLWDLADMDVGPDREARAIIVLPHLMRRLALGVLG